MNDGKQRINHHRQYKIVGLLLHLLANNILLGMKSNKEYDKIMTEIKSGLTGNANDDIIYLYQQGEYYKKHKLSKEITRDIGRIIFGLLPNEEREKFNNALSQDFSQFDSAFEDATIQMQKGNPSKALKIIESAMKRMETKTGQRVFFSDDSINVYRSFRNIIEEILYRELVHGNSKHIVRELPQSFFSLYMAHGCILVELKRFDEAKVPLLKALGINPVSTVVLFELGAVSQGQRDWKELFRLTQEAHKLSYTKTDFARCYRNFGFYFIEQKQFDDAMAIYYASLIFDSTALQNVQSQLYYIHHLTQKQIVQPNNEQILAVFKKNNINFGIDKNVFKIICELGQMLETEKEYENAKHCYKLLFELTSIDELKERIEKMPMD